MIKAEPITIPSEDDSHHGNSDESHDETDDDDSAYGKPKKDPIAVKFKKEVHEVLKCAKCKSSDFAISKELTSPPILVIEIEGVGKVHFPVYEEEAKSIIERFDQSPFGKRSQTVIDVTVRNSKQLEPDSFKIINNDWDNFLKQEILTSISKEMFIKTPFKASLYKLLLYEPGSFFKPHRDTEKEDGMFGTLIVQLPSKYAGGDLLVKHEDKAKTFNFSTIGHPSGNREFKMFFAAFYCDCQHEVLPITEGYRTCLVYNLVSTQANEIPVVPKFSELEMQLFNITRTWQQNQPSKIVYVLSHKYTESSLSLTNLKGTDRSVAAFLKYSAEKCSLKLFLGLFSKHVSGPAEGHKYDYTMFDPTYYYSLNNLISFTGSKISSGQLSVNNANEVIPIGHFKDKNPDKEEYQEYTGNEGASVDRWYNGAAIVFWPEDRTVPVLVENRTSHKVLTDFFFDAFQTYISSPEHMGLDKVLELLELVLKDSSSSFENSEQTLRILSAVIMLDSVPLLIRLLTKYNFLNEKCIQTVIDQCVKHGWKSLGLSIMKMFEKSSDWGKAVEMLDLLIPEECCSDLDKKEILTQCLLTIITNREKPLPAVSWYLRLSKTAPSDKQTFYSNAYVCANKLQFEMSEHVKKDPVLHAHVLLKLSESQQFSSETVWLNAANQCVQSLQDMTSKALTTPSLSRAETWQCTCEDCLKLKDFLRSNRKQENFKVAKPRRLHLHQRMNQMVDLTHETMRVGSPQTLVVTKTEGSFQAKVEEQKQAALLLPSLKAAISGASISGKPSKIIKLEL